MATLKVIQTPVSSIQPYERNARKHSDKQVRKIANSIKCFGFNNPVLIDPRKQIIAGHGRVEAAKILGLTAVPCIVLSHMTATETRAYILADNRLAELAAWDDEILGLELKELTSLDLDFDISLTGFEMGEIDQIISVTEPEYREPDLPPAPTMPVCRVGDLWVLGKHRLYCGDSRDPTSYEKLLDGRLADLVFADPPYNVPIPGNVTRQQKHGNFAMACGEMSAEEFTAWLNAIFRLAATHSRSGAVHYVCMDWRHIAELLDAARPIYSEQLNLCVWNKTNAGLGSMYRSKHELILVFKVGDAAHVNNIQLGRFGRYRTNVWDFPGMSSLQKNRKDTLAMHPTVKPVALVADAILDASRRGDLVLDPFGGSGSTLLAAEQTGRIAVLTEIDPAYADVIILRYQQASGERAFLAGANQSFAEVAALRLPPASRAGDCQ